MMFHMGVKSDEVSSEVRVEKWEATLFLITYSCVNN